MKKAILNKVWRITAGGLHCWCNSNVGVIKKENRNVPDLLWDSFFGRKPAPELKVEAPAPIVAELKWWQKIFAFIKRLFK